MPPQQPERAEPADVADRRLDDLGHALKSPLTALQGALELLRDGTDDGLGETGRRGLAVAMSATYRLGSLIDDILDLERARAGRLELELHVLPAGELLEASRAAYLQTAASRRSEVVTAADDADVVADPGQISRVLARLLESTAEVDGEAAPLRLSARRDGTDVTFTIARAGGEQHGTGAAGHRVGPGRAVGLKLAWDLCDTIVRRHHGRLWRDSDAGVSFTLPAGD